jgi:hypothetical protein
MQQLGRIRRTCAETGKTDCIWLDHTGACDRHCMPDDPIEWSLNPGSSVSQRIADDKGGDNPKIPKPHLCPKCACMFTGGNRCPNCGHAMRDDRITRPVSHEPGVLVERVRGGQHDLETMQRLWNRSIAVCVHKGRKLADAVGMFKAKFGLCPWEVNGLRYVPEPGEKWQQKAEYLFPSFKKVKVREYKKRGKNAQQEAEFLPGMQSVEMGE